MDYKFQDVIGIWENLSLAISAIKKIQAVTICDENQYIYDEYQIIEVWRFYLRSLLRYIEYFFFIDILSIDDDSI